MIRSHIREKRKTVRTIQMALDRLSVDGRIKRMGSRKIGYWEIIRDAVTEN